MIKILFSDLDGTLLYNNGKMTEKVTEKNCDSIKKFEKTGRVFAIATSRSRFFIEKLMKTEKRFDTVSYNGNISFCDNHIIDEVSFNYKEVVELNELLEAKNTENHITYYNPENDLFFYDYNYPKAQGFIENKLNYYQDFNRLIKEPIEDYLYTNNDYISAVFCVYPDKKNADRIRNKVSASAVYQIIDTSERTFTITKGYRNKVKGIRKIANYYQIKDDEIAVIGDSVNDLEMFKSFENSYCMFHAENEIKRQAKYIVESVGECIDKILSGDKNE